MNHQGREVIYRVPLHGPGIPVVRNLSLWICFMEMSWRIQIWVSEVYGDFCTPSHVTPSIAALSVLKRKLVSAASTLLPLWHLFFHVTEQGDRPADAWGATEGHQWALHSKSHPGFHYCLGLSPLCFHAQHWREADQWSGITLGPFALSFARVTAGLSGWDKMAHSPSFCFRISGEGPWAHLVCKSSQRFRLSASHENMLPLKAEDATLRWGEPGSGRTGRSWGPLLTDCGAWSSAGSQYSHLQNGALFEGSHEAGVRLISMHCHLRVIISECAQFGPELTLLPAWAWDLTGFGMGVRIQEGEAMGITSTLVGGAGSYSLCFEGAMGFLGEEWEPQGQPQGWGGPADRTTGLPPLRPPDWNQIVMF